MLYCECQHIDAILLYLDYSKASDTIEWPITDKELQYIGLKNIYKNR